MDKDIWIVIGLLFTLSAGITVGYFGGRDMLIKEQREARIDRVLESIESGETTITRELADGLK